MEGSEKIEQSENRKEIEGFFQTLRSSFASPYDPNDESDSVIGDMMKLLEKETDPAYIQSIKDRIDQIVADYKPQS